MIGDAALAELGNLTLVAVARRLGVAKSALYHHIDGRDGLALIAVDRALDAWQRPEPAASAAAFLADLAASLVRCLEDHPGLDNVLLELHAPPPTMIEAMIWAEHVLLDLGVHPVDAATAPDLAAILAHEDARHRRASPPGQWPESWLEDRLGFVLRGLRGA